MNKKKDAIVIGGGLAGLVATYILTNQGYDTLLVEKSNSLGGLTGSFQDKLGNYFDYGYHALDFNRSVFTTNFFKHVLDHDFRLLPLKRGLLIGRHLLRYNSPVANWPTELRELFAKTEIVDDIAEKPSRSELERVYGKKFVDLVYAEVLNAYPSLKWKLAQGASQESLLENIYPWFFPYATKQRVRSSEWHRYHDSMRRQGSEQLVLYPGPEGFGKILAKIFEKIPKSSLSVKQGFNKIDYDLDQSKRSIKGLVVDGEAYTSDMIFWCATPAALCSVFNIKLPAMLPQDFFLGSYVFDHEFNVDFHEILAGNPKFKANRISFTGALAGTPNNRVQLEYFAPAGEEALADDEWDRHWQSGLREYGLLSRTSTVKNFELRRMKRGFVSLDSYEQIIQSLQSTLFHKETNVIVPFWGVGPENINRLIPKVFQTVMDTITAGRT